MATNTYEDVGRPISIGHVNEQLEIVLDTAECEKVFLNDQVKNMPVAVASVKGPVRSGKSFMANCLLHEMDKQDGSEYTMMQPSTIFASRSGTDKVTVGFLIWSKPIIVEDARKKKVAVFILDTEGLLEDGAPEKRDILIFTFISRISSIQFYFFDGRLKPAELDYMEYLANTAKTILTTPASPGVLSFQNLVCLVRNWEGSDNFAFGQQGGKDYLASVRKEHGSAWASLSSHYSGVECILLPHPGDAVVGRTFYGYTNTIPDTFIAAVRELLAFMKAPENAVPRIIKGQAATGRTLYAEMEETASILRTVQLPNPVRLMDCLVIRDVGEARKQALNLYANNMRTKLKEEMAAKPLTINSFDRTHEIVRNSALQVFNAQLQQRNSTEHYELAKLSLQESIQSIYENYKIIHMEMQKKDEDQNMLINESWDQHKEDIKAKDKVINDLKNQADKKIKQLEAENAKLKLEQKNMDTQMQEQKRRLDEFLLANDSLTDQLKDKEEKMQRLNLEMHTGNKTADEKAVQIQKLTEELTKLKNFLQEVQNERDFKNEQIKDLQYEVQEASKELADYRKSYRNLQSQLDEANNNYDELNSKYMIKCKDLNEALGNAEFNEKMLQEALQREQEEKEKAVVDYSRTVSEVEGEKNSAEERAHILEGELHEAKKHIGELEMVINEDKQKMVQMEEFLQDKTEASSANFNKFDTLLRNAIKSHKEQKAITQKNLDTIVEKRVELINKIEDLKTDVANKVQSDKDSQKLLITVAVIITCLAIVLFNSKLNVFLWGGCSFVASSLFVALVIYYCFPGITHEDVARQKVQEELEKEGNRLLKIQKNLTDMIKSAQLLESLTAAIQNSTLSGAGNEAINEGVLTISNLPNILQMLRSSQVLPTNQNDIPYYLNVAQSEFGNKSLKDIKECLQTERKKLKKLL